MIYLSSDFILHYIKDNKRKSKMSFSLNKNQDNSLNRNDTEGNATEKLNLWFYEEHDKAFKTGFQVNNVLFSQKSSYQRVDILETSYFGKVMLIDGLMMVSEKDEFVYHEMIAHVPLLVHKSPKRVLIIGGGDGGTLREVLKHDSVEEVVMCEIDALVIDASRKYLKSLSCCFDHPKATVIVGDGVEYVKNAPPQSFDIVIVDSTDPIGPGVGLFSKDFYKNIKRLLNEDGIVTAQCESPWYENMDLSKVYSNLSFVFDKVFAYSAPVPTYPLGYWSWGFASNTFHPYTSINTEMAKKISEKASYYNQDIHRACFALPNFFKKKLKGRTENSKDV